MASLIFLSLLAAALLLPNQLCQSTEDEEKQILLDVKRQLIDSSSSLHDWNSSTTLCQWNGVRCIDDGGSIAGLNLSYFHLNGTLPSEICELPNLTTLILLFNNFREGFPAWISKCSKLSHLDLSQNFFNGSLPGNLSKMGLPLQHLDLSYNEFQGPVPGDFGELRGLEYLNLAGNLFTTLAPELGNLSNLTWLDLSNNLYLTPAPIPPEFGKLVKLTYLNVQLCQLIGSIPPELGGLKEMDFLQLQRNNLTGSIPAELMFLPKLTKLELYTNQLSGEIPVEIKNLVSLTDLDASQNSINGSIPEGISELKQLRLLQLYNNELSGELPWGLANLNHLETLAVYKNSLTGEIPENLGRNSSLTYVGMSRNKFTGAPPPFLCSNGGRLVNLSLYDNMLSGPIPESYGGCKSLQRFQMQKNNLQGPVPESIWSLPSLTTVNLESNKLNGSVSSSIRGAAQLSFLVLDDNEFEGEFPGELGELRNLRTFSATGNRFSGPVPFGSCSSLENLNLSRNELSGDISGVESCRNLKVLDLSFNRLSGSIPASLGNLQVNALDLSENQLTGAIPSSLGSLLLSELNVSYNNLQGPLPGAWKTSFPATSFQGNPQLCLDSCPSINTSTSSSKNHGFQLILAVVIVATILVLLLGVLGLWWQHHSMLRKYPRWSMRSFHRLSFNEMSVIEKLDEKNIIGSGLTGKVYRVDLANSRQTVAVKELFRSVWQDAAFQAEVRTLSNLRHRNIVKLLSCCSNRDANLLIFEYMPNGSLGDQLHGKQVVNLDWRTRHKIALGAARGLSYLHHDCFPVILHRDIKSNNILLDSDYEAKLADFGISKLLEDGNMTSVAGSYGYIAPEYAYTLKVNEKSDTYSFGVVLLELVTGKRPVESCFGECIDVVRWVGSRVHDKGGPLEVLDCRLRDDPEQEQKMIRLLNVALLCTSNSPAARPTMRLVVEMIQAIEPQQNSFKHQLDSKVTSPASSSSSSSPFDSY